MYIYESIVDEIAALISSGQLLPDSRIPSVREYASLRKVSVNSVKNAYRMLEDQGLIVARPQSGYYVCDVLPSLKNTPIAPIYNPVQPLGEQSQLLAMLVDKQQDSRYTDLALACPSGEHFYPVNRLRKLTSQLIRTDPAYYMRYALPPGSARLRAQIARRGLLLGMNLVAEDILITHGTMDALSIAVKSCSRPGDVIAIESPTFFNLTPLLKNLERQVVCLPTHPQSGLCLQTLEKCVIDKKITALITIPSGHNPLGFVMPEENRRALAKMASQYQFAIIEDAMYAELQFNAPLIANIKAFDSEGWVMVCASYTKTIAPDFRIGWLEAGRFKEQAFHQKFTSTVAESALLSDTLGLFLENGGYDLHLRHLRRLYRRQLDRIRACIATSFPEGTRVSNPQAGFILWLELPEGCDTLALFHAALDEHILCMPGLICSGNKAYNHCLRLAVCFDLTDRYRAAIRRLGQLAGLHLHQSRQ